MHGKLLGLGGALLTAAALEGMPVIAPESVTWSRNAATGVMTVGYTLGTEDAIVTMEVTTNGVPVSGRNLRRLAGDVNCKVLHGEDAKTITWYPDDREEGFRIADAEVGIKLTAWALDNPPDYLVIDLSRKNAYRFYPDVDQLPHGIEHHIYKTGYLVMRKVHAAGRHFRAGSPVTEAGRTASYENPHLVSFSADFYLGVYEVTRGQVKRVMNKVSNYVSASSLTDAPEYDEYPVDGVSYAYLRGSTAGWPLYGRGETSNKSFIGPAIGIFSGLAIDYPLEAEWEFACRAGSSSARYDGSEDDSTLAELAWYADNSGGSLHPVGTRKPNAWGFYDMYGNVDEWCHDWFMHYTDVVDILDPKGWMTMNLSGYFCDEDGQYNRVTRGGSFGGAAARCRSAARGHTGINTTAGMGVRLWCAAVIP